MELPLEPGIQSWQGEVVGLFLHSDLLPGNSCSKSALYTRYVETRHAKAGCVAVVNLLCVNMPIIMDDFHF
jgi:hypothetical protein